MLHVNLMTVFVSNVFFFSLAQLFKGKLIKPVGEPRKKTGRILSIESGLFSMDPDNGFLWFMKTPY